MSDLEERTLANDEEGGLEAGTFQKDFCKFIGSPGRLLLTKFGGNTGYWTAVLEHVFEVMLMANFFGPLHGLLSYLKLGKIISLEKVIACVHNCKT